VSGCVHKRSGGSGCGGVGMLVVGSLGAVMKGSGGVAWVGKSNIILQTWTWTPTGGGEGANARK